VRHLVLILLILGFVACKKAEPKVEPTSSTSPPTAPAATAAAPVASAWVEADPAKSLSDQLVAQLAAARQSGKKAYAYLHAAWCEPCVQIEKTRGVDPKMKAAFAPAYIIAIDIDKVDAKQVEALGMKGSVIPIFYRLDASGRATGDSIDGGAWGDNIPDNMAPPLAAFFAK
jgi:thiol:disulfide interchange protein